MNILDNSYASFCNLDHRTDRLEHMNRELKRVGLKAVRQRSFPWKETDYKNQKYRLMYERTPGAIGCWLSQVQVMKKAMEMNLHAFVMEDDLIFCSDFFDRMEYVTRWLWNNDMQWDIVWLGGTFHSPAYWHPIGNSGMRPDVSAQLGYDLQSTNDPRIKRTFGAFSTHAYIVRSGAIGNILGLLENHVHESIGIDHCMIRIQPKLRTYAFVPGSVKQMDNQSDIGNGVTVFSGFSRLNGNEDNSRYWFQDKMTDFDPITFNWQ